MNACRKNNALVAVTRCASWGWIHVAKLPCGVKDNVCRLLRFGKASIWIYRNGTAHGVTSALPLRNRPAPKARCYTQVT
jgi:Ni,Fe-hydrogenase I small subunit